MKLIPAMLLFFVPVVVSCSVDFGSTKVTRTIDPNLPPEDPGFYPDNPIVAAPTVISCPYKATNGCPDVWTANSADADVPLGPDVQVGTGDADASREERPDRVGGEPPALPDGSETDTDVDAPKGRIELSPTAGLATTEAGGVDLFTVVLTLAPRADVTIPISSSDLTEGTAAPSVVTFTTANWNVPQVITVTGVDDDLCDGNQAYFVVVGPAMSADTAYDGVDPSDISVVNVDNEGGGITIFPTTGLTTTEAGGTADFTIVLNCHPMATVEIPVGSSNTAEGTVSPANIVFTEDKWNFPQHVTVSGVDDSIHDGDQAYTVRTGPAVSNDPGFSGIKPFDVSVVNIDDDP